MSADQYAVRFIRYCTPIHEWLQKKRDLPARLRLSAESRRTPHNRPLWKLQFWHLRRRTCFSFREILHSELWTVQARTFS